MTELSDVLSGGDPQAAAALIAAGADVRYRREGGYDALIDAVHGRDIARDPRLMELLELLIAAGADLSGESDYGESGLSVLARIGRFDAVRRLLGAGADERLLGWTALIRAVVLGTAGEVEALIRGGAALEEQDRWSRTAWLVALLAGDIGKAELLALHGADTGACGNYSQPPLFYAIDGHHPEVVRWLLARGQDVERTDDGGNTPLMEAASCDDAACLLLLLDAGADVHRGADSGDALSRAESPEIVQHLLRAGADPASLSAGGRRALLGLGPEADRAQEVVPGLAPEEFRRASMRRFGRTNPEQMAEPLWEGMIRAGISAWAASRSGADAPGRPPVWCAARFGQSITALPDGGFVQIGGEHEDWYDLDFCIYNDLFLHTPDGAITIFGYPEADFPPTDFHTATLIGDHLWVIGSLGYQGTRRYGETPVYRFDLRTFAVERLQPVGEAPGWIYKHRADRAGQSEIRLRGGTVVTAGGEGEVHTASTGAFVLDTAALRWRREPG